MPGDSLEWYPWYWKDWRLSETRPALDAESRGIYRELLDECWAEGSFAYDQSRIARLCGCSEDAISRAWAHIKQKFERRPDGRFFNPTVQRVRQQQEEKRERFIERARKGGRGKAAKRLPQAEHKSAPTVQRERKTERLSIERGDNGAGALEAPRLSPDYPTMPTDPCGFCGGRKGLHANDCILATA